MTVKSDLEKARKKLHKDATKRIRKIAMEALSQVVTRTPALTGCARANWNVSLGAENESYDPKLLSQAPGQVIARESTSCASMNIGDVCFLTNTCPYIVALEFGHSKQNDHMVANTALSIKAQIACGQL